MNFSAAKCKLAHTRDHVIYTAGAEDGTLQAWDLSAGSFGQRLFFLSAHGGPVLTLQPPPSAAGSVWDGCVVSCGADGAVCIVSLASGSCKRVLPGELSCVTSKSTATAVH